MKTLLLALLAVGTAYAADPVKLSLEDFTDANGGKPGAGWTTEEGGVIRLTPQKGTGFLISKKEYASFEMEWDWKLADAGNNGIMLLGDHMLKPRRAAMLIPGPQNHAIKVGLEKYFLWKSRTGRVNLP